MELKIPVEIVFDDVNSVIDELGKLQKYKLGEGDDMTLVDVADVADVLTRHVKAREAKEPSIDAEQVVLCKDCKHSYTMMTARSKDGQERWTRFCDKHKTLFPKDDWFCKDGERKEE